MKNKLIVLWGSVLGFVSPAMVLAAAPATGQTTGTTGGLARTCQSVAVGTIDFILCKINQLLIVVVPIVIALGVVYFVYGIISYVIAGDEEAKKKGRDRIIFGIIGLAVIVSVWGLVRILTNTFGIDQGAQNITFPTTPY